MNLKPFLLRVTGSLAVLLLPLVSFAQTSVASGNVQSLFAYALSILNNYVVPIIFAIAFIVFIWGIYRYFIAGGAEEEKVKSGRNFLMWSIIGFVIMFSVWGIINLFINTLGLGSSSMPCIPTFGSGCAGTNSSSGFNMGSSNPLFGTSNTGSSSSNLYNSSTLPVGSVSSSGVTATPLYCSTVGTCTTYPVTGATYIPAGTQTSRIASMANATGANGGGECTKNSDCGSNLVCNDATGTCAADSPNVYSCQDDSAPNAAGMCANGHPPANQMGVEAPEDGTVPVGGSCAGNEDACSGSNSVCNDNGICATDTGNGTSDDGSNNSSNTGTVECSDGTTAPAEVGCTLCSDGVTTSSDDSTCPTGGSGAGFDNTNSDSDF